MNTGRPPFDNKLVRQAMNYAVDKDGIIKSLLRGEGTVLAAPMSPGLEGYDPNLKPVYDYNADKAKQLLSQAGFANGFDITLITPVGRYVQDKQIAEAIAGQLGKVGVRTQVSTFEGSYSKLKQGDWPDIMLIQQGGSATDNLYPICFSSKIKGLPWLNYTNPDVDALLDKAAVTTDAEQRGATYRELVKILQEDAPWVYLHYQTNIYGVRDRVKGFEPRPDLDIIVQPFSVA
jgi:peptide/nickel transport system substrate-binding protein